MVKTRSSRLHKGSFTVDDEQAEQQPPDLLRRIRKTAKTSKHEEVATNAVPVSRRRSSKHEVTTNEVPVSRRRKSKHEVTTIEVPVSRRRRSKLEVTTNAVAVFRTRRHTEKPQPPAPVMIRRSRKTHQQKLKEEVNPVSIITPRRSRHGSGGRLTESLAKHERQAEPQSPIMLCRIRKTKKEVAPNAGCRRSLRFSEDSKKPKNIQSYTNPESQPKIQFYRIRNRRRPSKAEATRGLQKLQSEGRAPAGVELMDVSIELPLMQNDVKQKKGGRVISTVLPKVQSAQKSMGRKKRQAQSYVSTSNCRPRSPVKVEIPPSLPKVLTSTSLSPKVDSYSVKIKTPLFSPVKAAILLSSSMEVATPPSARKAPTPPLSPVTSSKPPPPTSLAKVLTPPAHIVRVSATPSNLRVPPSSSATASTSPSPDLLKVPSFSFSSPTVSSPPTDLVKGSTPSSSSEVSTPHNFLSVSIKKPKICCKQKIDVIRQKMKKRSERKMMEDSPPIMKNEVEPLKKIPSGEEILPRVEPMTRSEANTASAYVRYHLNKSNAKAYPLNKEEEDPRAALVDSIINDRARIQKMINSKTCPADNSPSPGSSSSLTVCPAATSKNAWGEPLIKKSAKITWSEPLVQRKRIPDMHEEGLLDIDTEEEEELLDID